MGRRSAIVIGLAAACIAALGAQTATAAKSKPPEQRISLLFAQTATKGTMKPVEGTPRFHLRLQGVNPQVVWFSDRPARQSGQLPVGGFARSWAGFGFLDDPPNAALTLLHAGDRHDTVIVKLGKPHFKPKKHLVRYSARRLDAATGDLSYLNSDVDPRVRRHFRSPSLFIDDATAPVVRGCVIQPYTRCPGADLSSALLSEAQLRGADLVQANLSRADLTAANLTEANLTRADLSGANLSKPNPCFHGRCNGADLTGADLRYSELVKTNLSYADLSGAKLNGATISNSTIFCHTTMPGGANNNSNC